MDQYTMTEEAYKNGYEAGIKKFAEKLKENIDTLLTLHVPVY